MHLYKIVLMWTIVFSLFSRSFSDEIHLMDGLTGKGKIVANEENFVLFIKNGNEHNVKINKDFIDYLVIDTDTIRIVHPPRALIEKSTPVKLSPVEISELKRSDSIKVAISDSLDAVEYTKETYPGRSRCS